jgi:hypothetical protein
MGWFLSILGVRSTLVGDGVLSTRGSTVLVGWVTLGSRVGAGVLDGRSTLGASFLRSIRSGRLGAGVLLPVLVSRDGRWPYAVMETMESVTSNAE